MLEFSDLFQIPFVFIILKALLVGVLVSVCSSLLGVNLVMKRYSMIGDGLSHVAFGAMTVATVANLAPTVIALPVTVISAVLILRANGKSKLMGDASIAMISVSSLALGYVILNVFSASSNLAGDVCSSLFGSTSILTLSTSDVVLCVVLTLIIIACYVLMYNKFFAITFDADFSSAIGNKTELYNTVLAVMCAVIIVLAMKLVGALLISALIIFPALTAMRIANKFKSVVVLSAVISVICTSVGIILSCLISTPVGATIVVVDLALYVSVWIFHSLKYRKS